MAALILALALALADREGAAASAREPDAQGPTPAPAITIPPAVAALDRRRNQIQLAGMATLTGFAVANIVGGVIGNLATPASDARYFHQMNALWNTVNLTLGAIGLRSAIRARPRLGRRLGVVRDVTRTQRVFAVNALLDVVYMLGGLTTWELGKDLASARVRGYGAAVIFQGAFLMAFDLAMIQAHEGNLRRSGLRVGVAPSPTGAALSLGGRF